MHPICHGNNGNPQARRKRRPKNGQELKLCAGHSCKAQLELGGGCLNCLFRLCIRGLEANDLYGDFADSLALHLGSMPHLGQLLIHVMQTACHVALVALLISPRPIKGWGKPSRQILSRHHSTYLAYLYQWGIWAIPLLGPGRAKRPMTYLTWTATLSKECPTCFFEGVYTHTVHDMGWYGDPGCFLNLLNNPGKTVWAMKLPSWTTTVWLKYSVIHWYVGDSKSQNPFVFINLPPGSLESVLNADVEWFWEKKDDAFQDKSLKSDERLPKPRWFVFYSVFPFAISFTNLSLVNFWALDLGPGFLPQWRNVTLAMARIWRQSACHAFPGKSCLAVRLEIQETQTTNEKKDGRRCFVTFS